MVLEGPILKNPNSRTKSRKRNPNPRTEEGSRALPYGAIPGEAAQRRIGVMEGDRNRPLVGELARVREDRLTEMKERKKKAGARGRGKLEA